MKIGNGRKSYRIILIFKTLRQRGKMSVGLNIKKLPIRFILKWGNLISIIVSIAVAIGTIWMAIATHHLAVESHQANLNAIEVAKSARRSAEAAERSLSIMDSSMWVSNRAYLTVTGLAFVSGDGSHMPFGMAVKIKNIGNTPAYNVHLSLVKIAFTKKIIDDKNFDIDTTQVRTIGANIQEQILVPSETASNPHDSNIFFFLGKVIYKDIFGHTHYTQYGGIHSMSLGNFNFIRWGRLYKAN